MKHPNFTEQDYRVTRHVLVFAKTIATNACNGDLGEQQMKSLSDINEACEELIRKIDGDCEVRH